MSQPTSAMHRSILCVDVADFSNRSRTDNDHTAVRSGVYLALEHALSASQVNWDDCYHEDRGDGALVLIPPQVSKSNLVTFFPAALTTALTRHNEIHDPPARIRLRVALHAGEVRHDEHGVVGRPVILAFRLLEAEEVKEAPG